MSFPQSVCKRKGWLHNFQIVKQYRQGVVERCMKCGERKFFPNNIDNTTYLMYHERSAIQRDNPRFNHEYNK